METITNYSKNYKGPFRLELILFDANSGTFENHEILQSDRFHMLPQHFNLWNGTRWVKAYFRVSIETVRSPSTPLVTEVNYYSGLTKQMVWQGGHVQNYNEYGVKRFYDMNDKPITLPNAKNTCYFSALVQSLLSVERIAHSGRADINKLVTNLLKLDGADKDAYNAILHPYVKKIGIVDPNASQCASEVFLGLIDEENGHDDFKCLYELFAFCAYDDHDQTTGGPSHSNPVWPKQLRIDPGVQHYDTVMSEDAVSVADYMVYNDKPESNIESLPPVLFIDYSAINGTNTTKGGVHNIPPIIIIYGKPYLFRAAITHLSNHYTALVTRGLTINTNGRDFKYYLCNDQHISDYGMLGDPKNPNIDKTYNFISANRNPFTYAIFEAAF